MTRQYRHYLEEELYQLVASDAEVFDFLQAGSLDGVWYWDLKNPEHEWMSEAFWRTLGFAPEEKQHLASEWKDLIDPEDRELALDNFRKHLADPTHPYDQIVRYRNAQGGTTWVRCRGLAIRDQEGNPHRMLGAHTEVTRLKEAELRNLALEKELEKVSRSLWGTETAVDPAETSLEQRITELRQVNHRLAQANAFVQSSQEAIITMDLQGCIDSWNPRATEIYGYSRDEIIGCNISQLVGDDSYFNGLYQRDRDTSFPTVNNYCTVHYHSSGRPIQVAITISPVDDLATGTTIGVSLTARDISRETVLNRPEAAQSSQDKQDWILEQHYHSSPDMYVSFKLSSGEIIQANHSFCSQLEIESSALKGQSIYRYLGGASLTEFQAAIANREMKANQKDIELSLEAKEAKLPVLASFSLGSDSSALQIVHLSLRDFSERQHTNRLFKLAVQSSPNGIIIFDQQGKINFANPAVERVFGYSNPLQHPGYIQKLLPKAFGDQTDGEAPLPIPQPHLAQKTTGMRRGGGSIHLETIFAPVQVDGQQQNLATIVDLSTHQRIRSQLDHQHEALEQLLYTVSHDLRSPLITIQGFLGFTLEAIELSQWDEAKTSAMRSQAAAKTLGSLLEDLLELSRVGRNLRVPEPVSIDHLLTDILSSLAIQIADADATITRETILPTINSHRSPLRQILLNLLSNALKHGRPAHGPPQIVVGHLDLGEEYHFYVKDNGQGIERQRHREVFQIFRKLSDDSKGSGLGLAIVQKAARALGGTAWVNTEAVQGCEFWFSVAKFVSP